MRRGCFLVVCAAMLGAAPARAGHPLVHLPLEHVPTTMALTEDGLLLVVAHEKANRLTVFDVKTGRAVATPKCTAPRYVLCRGDRVFVAGYGAGTIDVFSQAKGFKLVENLLVGAPEVFFLSAPQGKYFTGEILASCGAKPPRTFYRVDADKDQSRKLKQSRATSVLVTDYRGRMVIETGEPHAWHPQGKDEWARVYTYTDYLGRREHPLALGCRFFGLNTDALAVQRHDLPAWTSVRFLGGLPLRRMGPGTSGMKFPDASRRIHYAWRRHGLDPTRVEAYSLAPAPNMLGAWDVEIPKGYTGMSFRNETWTRSATEGIVARFPCAVTHGEMVYLFMLCWRQRQEAVFRLVLPAAPATPTSRPAPGRHYLVPGQWHLAPSREAGSVLLLQQTHVWVLRSRDCTVRRVLSLPGVYRTIHERPDGFVALGPRSVDVLNNRTGALVRRIPLRWPLPYDMVPHPTLPFSYVSVEFGPADRAPSPLHQQKNDVRFKQVLEVDEKNGRVRVLPRVYGQWLAVGGEGKFLYTSIRSMLPACYQKPWLGEPSDGHYLDLYDQNSLYCYALAHRSVRPVGAATEVGRGKPLSLRAAPQGGLGALVSSQGCDDARRVNLLGVGAYAGGTLAKPAVWYSVGPNVGSNAVMVDVAFHPTRPLVALALAHSLYFFHRRTGRLLTTDKGGAYPDLQQIHEIQFSPDGESLLVVHWATEKTALGGVWKRPVLRALPIPAGLNGSPDP